MNYPLVEMKKTSRESVNETVFIFVRESTTMNVLLSEHFKSREEFLFAIEFCWTFKEFQQKIALVSCHIFVLSENQSNYTTKLLFGVHCIQYTQLFMDLQKYFYSFFFSPSLSIYLSHLLIFFLLQFIIIVIVFDMFFLISDQFSGWHSVTMCCITLHLKWNAVNMFLVNVR